MINDKGTALWVRVSTEKGEPMDNSRPVIPGHDNCHDIAEMAYNNGYSKGCEDSKQKSVTG